MHALIKQHAGIFLRGMMVGVADLIPGVSGGTIAFITGIYARLLKAVKLGSSPMLLADAAAWQYQDISGKPSTGPSSPCCSAAS